MAKAGMLKDWGWRSGWVGLGVLAVIVVLGAGEPVVRPPEIPEASRRINAFTFDLLHRHAAGANAPASAVLSAQSIYHSLAMSYVASGGKTRAELSRTVGFPLDHAGLLTDLKKLREDLHRKPKRGRGAELVMANACWLDDRIVEYRKEYLRQIEDFFDVEPEQTSFEEAERAAARINRWVSKQTRERIKSVVKPEDFASRSVGNVVDEAAFVLVNAVWFKGAWQNSFKKEDTASKPFHVDETTTTPAPMMQKRGKFLYAEDEDFQLLELPYQNFTYSMYVLLPRKPEPVEKWLPKVTQDSLVKMMSAALERSVDVVLPRFESRGHLDAKEILKSMGVRDAFDDQAANFDWMIHKQREAFRIYISTCVHEAWLSVDEEGSEGAAATSATHRSFGCTAQPIRDPVLFQADHPFLYLIVHNESRSILFSGWFSDPRELAGNRE